MTTIKSASGDTTLTVDFDKETGAFTLNVNRYGHNAHSFTLGRELATEPSRK